MIGKVFLFFEQLFAEMALVSCRGMGESMLFQVTNKKESKITFITHERTFARVFIKVQSEFALAFKLLTTDMALIRLVDMVVTYVNS